MSNMHLSGIKKVQDLEMREYSLDSLNEFLKIEESGANSGIKGSRVEKQVQQVGLGDSNLEFSKKQQPAKPSSKGQTLQLIKAI